MGQTELKEETIEGKSGEIIVDVLIEIGQEEKTVVVPQDVQKLVIKNCEGSLYIRPSLQNLEEVHLENCQLPTANILVPTVIQARRCTITNLLHVDLTEEWNEGKGPP